MPPKKLNVTNTVWLNESTDPSPQTRSQNGTSFPNAQACIGKSRKKNDEKKEDRKKDEKKEDRKKDGKK
ncbi:unnamed protein product [Prunus brigantina]